MQLTDTQLVVLSAALAREDGLILPLPTPLKGGAVAKVCSALLAKGLAEEVALSRREAQAAPQKGVPHRRGREADDLAHHRARAQGAQWRGGGAD
jgi:hypothetical protein